MAVAHSIRDRLIESFNDTQQYMHVEDVKRVYYMSLEFLLGRAMQNALVNLRLEQNYSDALMVLFIFLIFLIFFIFFIFIFIFYIFYFLFLSLYFLFLFLFFIFIFFIFIYCLTFL